MLNNFYKLEYSKSEEILPTLISNSIDAIVSDIPYGVNINSEWDRNIPSEGIWNECYRVLKPGAHCVIFGQPSMVPELISIMGATEFEYRDMWIWNYQGTHTKGYKTEDKKFRSKIRNVFNPIFIYRKKLEGTEEENWNKYGTNLLNIDCVREQYKGDHKSILDKFNKTGKKHLQSDTKSNTFKKMSSKGWIPNSKGAEPTNIKYFTRATTFERTINNTISNSHETVKPIKLMLWLIKLVTNRSSQIVLDPFMGTGSTGCACKLLNRNFIGIDCNEKWVTVAKFRIDNIDSIKDYFKDDLIGISDYKHALQKDDCNYLFK